MLSVVVCSVNSQRFEAFADNVRQTIGAEYELVKIANEGNAYSLTQAYNQGAEKANGDLLCFIHEDVKFHTQNWGQTVRRVFADTTVGLLGVAGSYYYPLPPVGWYELNENEMNVFLHLNRSSGELVRLALSKFPEQNLVQTAVVDGVFMVLPKALFGPVAFDEKNLRGFHGYDIDISLQVGLTHKVVVTKEILLEHFSEGKKDAHWHEAIKALAEKWKATLPRFVPIYSPKEKKEVDLQALDAYFRNRHCGPDGFCQRQSRLFKYAATQGLKREAVKIILRYLLKPKKAE